MDANNGVWVRLRDARDKLVLGAGHFQRRAIKALALPIGREPDDDYSDVGRGCELLGRSQRLLWVDLLATAEPLDRHALSVVD